MTRRNCERGSVTGRRPHRAPAHITGPTGSRASGTRLPGGPAPGSGLCEPDRIRRVATRDDHLARPPRVAVLALTGISSPPWPTHVDRMIRTRGRKMKPGAISADAVGYSAIPSLGPSALAWRSSRAWLTRSEAAGDGQPPGHSSCGRQICHEWTRGFFATCQMRGP